jgi:hypothetical protein
MCVFDKTAQIGQPRHPEPALLDDLQDRASAHASRSTDMTVKPDDAAASLSAIAAVEQRTRQTLAYGRSGAAFILWGVLLAIGYTLEHFSAVVYSSPAMAKTAWGVVAFTGFAGCALLIRRKSAQRRSRADLRLLYGQLVLYGYGWIFVTMLWPLTPRQLNVFWPNIFMLGFVIAGLWLGHLFMLLGLSLTALSLVGYVWAGDWFALWMAVVGGGGLILGGLWLRRVGGTA